MEAGFALSSMSTSGYEKHPNPATGATAAPAGDRGAVVGDVATLVVVFSSGRSSSPGFSRADVSPDSSATQAVLPPSTPSELPPPELVGETHASSGSSQCPGTIARGGWKTRWGGRGARVRLSATRESATAEVGYETTGGRPCEVSRWNLAQRVFTCHALYNGSSKHVRERDGCRLLWLVSPSQLPETKLKKLPP